jgi:hypothetical protein
MLGDLKEFIGENDEVMLDVLQFVLMGCGLVPVVGEACDGIDAAVSFSRGDWAGGLLSLGSAIPGLGWASTGVKAWKNSDKLRGIKQLIEKIMKKEGGGCPNSFVPGTRVLLADGRSEEIEDLRIGDTVLAADPVGGRTGGRAITATISSTGIKNLVDLDVVDGDRTATISATDNHPFWVPARATWLPAGELSVGTDLQNSLEYVKKAKGWFDNPPATVQTKTRSNGDVVRYDAETDYFGVITADGRPKTFFVPDPSKHNYPTNQEYFDAQ